MKYTAAAPAMKAASQPMRTHGWFTRPTQSMAREPQASKAPSTRLATRSRSRKTPQPAAGV